MKLSISSQSSSLFKPGGRKSNFEPESVEAVEVHLVNPDWSYLETFCATGGAGTERSVGLPASHAEKIQVLFPFFFCGNSGHMCLISLGLVASVLAPPTR